MAELDEVKRVLNEIEDSFEEYTETEDFELYLDVDDYAIIRKALKELVDCPFKSSEGLIEKITRVNDEYMTKHGVYLSADGCIQIIKEYCEVK